MSDLVLDDASREDDFGDDSAMTGADDSDQLASVSILDEDLDDPELAAIKLKVKEMEEEAAKLREMKSNMDSQMGLTSPISGSGANFGVGENFVYMKVLEAYIDVWIFA